MFSYYFRSKTKPHKKHKLEKINLGSDSDSDQSVDGTDDHDITDIEADSDKESSGRRGKKRHRVGSSGSE